MGDGGIGMGGNRSGEGDGMSMFMGVCLIRLKFFSPTLPAERAIRKE